MENLRRGLRYPDVRTRELVARAIKCIAPDATSCERREAFKKIDPDAADPGGCVKSIRIFLLI